MDAPERDVRLFAVRLFWDRHRPRALPDGFAPRKPGASIGTQRFARSRRRFASSRARCMFGLPPGRVGERDPVVAGAPAPERALPASIAKRRLVESLRDVALEDLELARAIGPGARRDVAFDREGRVAGERAGARAAAREARRGGRRVRFGPWIERLEAIAVARELVAVAGVRDGAATSA